jgi:hypothetical protein
MDKLTTYQAIVRRVIGDIAGLIARQPVEGIEAGVETQCAFDDEHGQYLLISVGWAGDRRIRGTTVYVRLRDGKFWIEEDWTEEGIATELVKAGVPKEDIVLGFHPPQLRPATEFAVA